MKKLAWLFVILSSLVLPNVFQSLYGSLADDKWQIYLYLNGLTPQATINWLMSSAITVLAITTTARWYHRKTMRITLAIMAGTAFSSLMSFLIENFNLLIFRPTSNELRQILFTVESTEAVAYTITGLLATLAGIMFAKPIVVPDGDSPAIRNILRPFLYLAEKIFGREKIRERTRLWWRMQA